MMICFPKVVFYEPKLLCRRGNQRRVSVYKATRKVDNINRKESFLMFSEKSKMALRDLFAKYPPQDTELGARLSGKENGKGDKIRGKKDDIFCKPSMNKAEIAKKVEALTSRIERAAHLRQVLQFKTLI